MRPATPQFAAEKRFAEPTPMVESVMLCVVENRDSRVRRAEKHLAPAVSAQNPPTGCSLTIFVAVVIDDPPPARKRSETDRRVRRKHDP